MHCHLRSNWFFQAERTYRIKWRHLAHRRSAMRTHGATKAMAREKTVMILPRAGKDKALIIEVLYPNQAA